MRHIKPKLLRITTHSISLDFLLKGQLKFLNQYFEVVGIASEQELLNVVAKREGIRTVNIEMRREINLISDLKSLYSFIKLFYNEKPFIVHANTPKASLISMIAALICRVPHRIYTVTGLRFETTTGIFRYVLILMEKITCLCATKVIPEGDGVIKTLRKENITNKPLKKICNGNINGIDLMHFDRKEEVLKEAFNIKKPMCFTFCFIGRLVKDKGINELVRAFIHLYSKKSNIRLILVGSFEKELDPINIDVEDAILHHPGILFLGWKDDVRPFYAASDALVFPSYREGFPNVVIQAGAMGLPSIVTDINGCNEIILEGENGLIIPPADENALYEAMNYFIENSNHVIKMAKNARPMVANRYEQNMVWKALLHEYNTL